MNVTTFSVSRSFGWGGEITDKAAKVMRMFGLTAERLGEGVVSIECRLTVKAGEVVYITGPSGCGKSVLLGELEKAVSAADRINLNEVKLPADRPVVDCIDGDFIEVLRLLSVAGLNDVFCVLNEPANLSDGEKWRFRLATALSAGKRFVFADEFCANLDRITAAVIAYNVHKFARRNGVTFILASSHDDILSDLQPDVLVVKELAGPAEVIYKGQRSEVRGQKSEVRRQKRW